MDCVFTHTNLSNIRVDHCKFLDTRFTDCKLVGVDWTRADWPRFNSPSPFRFHQCILNDSSFFGLNLSETQMTHCKLHDVDFRHGDFSESQFMYSDFTHSLFMQTNLKGADFSEAIAYDIDIFHNLLEGARFSRYEAIRLLHSLNIDLID